MKTYPLADLLGPDLRWRSDGLDSSGRLLGRQARARPMRWRFFSTDPGSTVKCTCPSSSIATTRTTACAWRFPATSITPRRIREGSRASLRVDQPHPRSQDIPDLQESQATEPDQRYPLGQLVDSSVADSED